MRYECMGQSQHPEVGSAKSCPGLPPWDDLCVERMTLSEQLHAEGWLTHSEAGGSEEEHGDDYFRTDKTDSAA
jgi:hypothetical protein